MKSNFEDGKKYLKRKVFRVFRIETGPAKEPFFLKYNFVGILILHLALKLVIFQFFDRFQDF